MMNARPANAPLSMPAMDAGSEIHHLLVEYLVTPVVSWFDDLYTQVRKKDDRLLTLQLRLKEVPRWSAASVDDCMGFLRGRCSFLNEMVTALFLHCIKSMTVIKNTHELAITVRIPKRAAFMHSVMVAVAKEFYENPFIFRRNDRAAKEAVVLRSLSVCALKALPMKDLLNAYLNTEAPPESGPGVDAQELVVRNLNAPPRLDPRTGQLLAAAAVAAPGAVPAILERMRREAADLGILNSNLNHDVIEHVVKQAPPSAGASPTHVHAAPATATATATATTSGAQPTPATAMEDGFASSSTETEPRQADEKVIVPSILSSSDSIASEDDELFPRVPRKDKEQQQQPGSPASGSSSSRAMSPVRVASVIRESDKTIDIVRTIAHGEGQAAAGSGSGDPSQKPVEAATAPATKKAPRRAQQVARGTRAGGTKGRGGAAAAGTHEQQGPLSAASAPTATTTSVNVLTKRQQNALLDEILNQTRTREMLTPTFFSDAASKSKE